MEFSCQIHMRNHAHLYGAIPHYGCGWSFPFPTNHSVSLDDSHNYHCPHAPTPPQFGPLLSHHPNWKFWDCNGPSTGHIVLIGIIHAKILKPSLIHLPTQSCYRFLLFCNYIQIQFCYSEKFFIVILFVSPCKAVIYWKTVIEHFYKEIF